MGHDKEQAAYLEGYRMGVDGTDPVCPYTVPVNRIKWKQGFEVGARNRGYAIVSEGTREPEH